MIRNIFRSAALAALLSSCAGGGAGPMGLGAVLGDRNLASAEPLFTKEESKCLSSADGLLSAVFLDGQQDPKTTCGKFFTAIRAMAVTRGSITNDRTRFTGIPQASDSKEMTTWVRYDKQARNEIIDALIATSNYKCGRYSALLKNADGAANVTLSIGSILTGGLGAFVGGPAAAKALSGSAAILSGSRAAVNEVYLTNQTIHVLAAAFEKARDKQRDRITNLEDCPEDKYSLMRGIEDAFSYHNSCSLVTGLAETVLAVERTDNPGLNAMRQSLAEYAMLIRQANDLASGSPPAPVAGQPVITNVASLKALTEKITEAQTVFTKQNTARLDLESKVRTKSEALNSASDADKKDMTAALDKLKRELATAVDSENQAKWLIVGLEAELQRTLQLMASRTSAPSSQPRPESRKCPYNA